MANAQKITEIIDEKALRDWERFVESLIEGQNNMAKVVSEANEMNKSLTGAKSMAQFSKDAEKASIQMEKLAQEQAKTAILNERLLQSEMRTIKMVEQRAKKEAEAAVAAERAAKSKQRANERMAQNEKDLSSSIEQTGDFIVQNEKDIQRAMQASEATARSSRDGMKAASKESREAVEQESIAYDGYRNSIDKVIAQNLELKFEMKQLKEEYKLLGESVPLSEAVRYEKRIQEVNSAIKQNNTEIRRLAKENTSAEGSMDSLESQLNSLRSAYRALSAEERETSVEAQNLLAEIQKLDAEFKEQKKSIGQHQDEVGNYALIWDKVPGPIRSVVDSLNDAGDAAEGVSFQGIINGLKAMVAQAWAFIRTPIGAAIAAVTAIVSGAKVWFDYNKGLVEATRLTEQLTGATGDTAKVIRDDLLASSEAFDKDFNEVLRSANTLSKEFNISLSEASDLLNTGFIRGADASGQLLDNVREYSSQMRAAGLSADEMLAILIRSEKEGVFSDKGVDAIKEATLRLREMTDTTRTALTGVGIDADKLQADLVSGQLSMFEAIQQVSIAMSGFSENSMEVGQVLADVFAGPGEDAGLRYLKMLGDINLEQETSLENLTDIEKAQVMQLEATEELNREYSTLFDATGGGFELMIANIKVLATGWLVSLLKGIRRLYNWFVELYNESIIFRGVVEAIPLAFRQVIAAGKLMFDFLGNGFEALGDAIKAVLTGNFDDLSGIWKDYMREMGSDTKKFLSSTGDNIGTALRNTRSGSADIIGDYDLSADSLSGTGSGTGTGSNGSGSGGSKVADKIIAARKKLNDKMVELSLLRLNAEKKVLDELGTYNRKIIDDEYNAFEDRFNALTDFNSNRIESIDKQNQIELESLNKLRSEALELQKEGKDEEYKIQLEIIQIQEEQIKNETLKAKRELSEEVKALTMDLLRDRYGQETTLTLSLLEDRIQQELLILAERYAAGELNEREYQEGRLKIQENANREYLQTEIGQLQALIDLGKERNLDTRTLEEQMASLKIELSRNATDQQISDLERLTEMEEKAAERRKEIYKEIANASFEFLDAMFSRRISDIEKDIELTEEEKEKELESVENSTMTEEEKERRIYAINAKYAQKEEELDRKKKEAQLKQARFQKAQAVMNIALSTAQGIARAFADFWFPAAVPIAASIGVLGAIQLATALAQPLPQYWTGTDSSEGGLAHVGERGSELFVTPDGTIGLTPPKDTIMNLEEGTKIFNAQETRKIMSGNPSKSDSVLFQRMLEENTITNRKLVKAFESSEIHSTIITKSGWREQIKKNRDFKNYLRRNGIK